MKLFLQTLVVLVVLNCVAIAVAAIHSNRASPVDVRMIGLWQGEYTEKEGALKSWRQTRNEDGSYQIEFRFIENDGTVNRLVEEGQWWIEKGLFYEIAPSWMTLPDAYQYRFLDDGCIEFLLVESHESAEDVGQYQFVECLSELQPSI